MSKVGPRPTPLLTETDGSTPHDFEGRLLGAVTISQVGHALRPAEDETSPLQAPAVVSWKVFF